MLIRITTVSELLGTMPGTDEVFQEYVASKAPEGSEPETLNADEIQDQIVKGTTIFPRNKAGEICFLTYQIKGFLKAKGDLLRARAAQGGEKGRGSKWGSVKGKIDDNVHVFPVDRQTNGRRYIRMLREGKPIHNADDFFERPMRVMTAQGPRVCLARSERLQDGITADFEIMTRGLVTEEQIVEILLEGEFHGLLQWRNAGYGCFTFEILG